MKLVDVILLVVVVVLSSETVLLSNATGRTVRRLPETRTDRIVRRLVFIGSSSGRQCTLLVGSRTKPCELCSEVDSLAYYRDIYAAGVIDLPSLETRIDLVLRGARVRRAATEALARVKEDAEAQSLVLGNVWTVETAPLSADGEQADDHA